MAVHKEQFEFGFRVDGSNFHGTVQVEFDGATRAIETAHALSNVDYLVRQLKDDTETGALSWYKTPVPGLFTATDVVSEIGFSISPTDIRARELQTRQEIANYSVHGEVALSGDAFERLHELVGKKATELFSA